MAEVGFLEGKEYHARCNLVPLETYPSFCWFMLSNAYICAVEKRNEGFFLSSRLAASQARRDDRGGILTCNETEGLCQQWILTLRNKADLFLFSCDLGQKWPCFLLPRQQMNYIVTALTLDSKCRTWGNISHGDLFAFFFLPCTRPLPPPPLLSAREIFRIRRGK